MVHKLQEFSLYSKTPRIRGEVEMGGDGLLSPYFHLQNFEPRDFCKNPSPPLHPNAT